MTKEIHELTASGCIKKPLYSLLAEWVKDAWESLDPNLIKRSFKCCGISIAQDGSEDDWIFDYDKLSNKPNQNVFVNETEDLNEELYSNNIYDNNLLEYENDWTDKKTGNLSFDHVNEMVFNENREDSKDSEGELN